MGRGSRVLKNGHEHHQVTAFGLSRAAVLAAGTGAVAMMAGTAAAQLPEQLPGAVEPGRIERQFEPGVEPQAEPRPDADPGEQPIPPGAEEVRFVLQGVTVDGATVFDEGVFQPLYADLIGQEVSLADIFEVANAATALYRGEGYILSLVVVPQQEVADGVVRLQAIEGRIANVTVEGDIAGSESWLQAIANKIAETAPFRTEALERYLLILDDLGGVTARGVLSASPDTPGASDLAVVMEHDPVDGFVSIDNRGSRFIGPFIASAGISGHSLLGQYETISIQGATVLNEPDELQFGSISGRLPIFTEGTALNASISYSSSNPGFTLSTLDLDSSSFSWTFGADHPLIRSREENLRIGLEFTWRDSETRFQGRTLSDDNVRTIGASASYDFVDDLLGVNLIEGEIVGGLPIFGASSFGDEDLTRPEAEPQAVRFTGSVTRVQRILPGFAVLGSVSGQIATGPLLASEEFGFGGAEFGRGYDPSEITGDHGLATKIELQYGGDINEFIVDSYQLYAFYDHGWVWDEDVLTGAGDVLSSAGAGVRANLLDNVSINFEVAGQIGGPSASNGRGDEAQDRDVRVLFGVVGRF